MSVNSARDACLEDMMLKHGNSLLRMAAIYLRDASLAEDAVQETFIKAYGRMGSFRGESSLKTWLMRILINTCHNYLRSPWMKRVDHFKTPDELPENSYSQEFTDSTVITEVMNLPPRLREAILLRYYQDMQILEIARALGVSQSAVKQRIKRANRLLSGKLERWYFDE